VDSYKQTFNLCSDTESRQNVSLQLDDIKDFAAELELRWALVS